MSWERRGDCNHCGMCCLKTEMAMPHMLDHKQECKYIYRQDDLIFCEIRQAVEGGDDEFLELIPEKDLKYWENECRDYPDPDEPAHLPPGYNLPSRCSYELKEKVS